MVERFDYIVVGGGSAGCVLANRLSADPRNRVLVLEAGGRDDWIWFHIPVGYLFSIGNPRADWMFETQAIPGLDGRALNYPRGKVIGGSSAINAMIYMRGQAADYDGWRQLGLAGWGWDDVLPLFLAQEDHIAPPSALHRSGGEWRVEHPRMRWDVLDAFAQAAELAGIPPVDDFNGGDNFGCGYFQVNQKAGRRWSAASAFLKPVLKRPNLKLETGAQVSRVLIEDGRAVGVAWTKGGVAHEARADGEVVLAAGAVGTPHLLELSGVGDGERLQALGIETVRRPAGRRREPAGPSADPALLRGRRRADDERPLRVLLAAAADGAGIRALSARTDVDGAVAAGGLRAVFAGARHAQRAVPRPAAVARQLRRGAARLPGHHHQRLQPAADQPRRDPPRQPRSDGAAADPAQLSVDAGRRARRRRVHAPGARGSWPRRRCSASPPRSVGPARRPVRRRTAQCGPRPGDHDLPSGRHGEDGPRVRSDGRASTTRLRVLRPRRACASPTPRSCRGSPPATPIRRP